MLNDTIKMNRQDQSGRYGYKQVHDWVRSKLGKARTCENCHSQRNVDWANISQDYLYDLNDWKPLCRSCHKRHDLSLPAKELSLSSLTVVNTKKS